MRIGHQIDTPQTGQNKTAARPTLIKAWKIICGPSNIFQNSTCVQGIMFHCRGYFGDSRYNKALAIHRTGTCTIEPSISYINPHESHGLWIGSDWNSHHATAPRISISCIPRSLKAALHSNPQSVLRPVMRKNQRHSWHIPNIPWDCNIYLH